MSDEPVREPYERSQAQRSRDHPLCFAHFVCFIRKIERGEDSSFEFTTLIVPIIMMILLVAFATIVRAAQMPVWTAASECAHAAVISSTQDLGKVQGTQAALDSLQGNSIDPNSIQIVIEPYDEWTPNSLIRCNVSYNIDVSNLAFITELTGGYVPTSAQVTLRIEPYKSKWE